MNSKARRYRETHIILTLILILRGGAELSIVIRLFIFGILSVIWAIVGLFFWILIVGRVVFYVSIQLFSALFSQQKPMTVAPMVNQVSTIYIDGFKDLYGALFGKQVTPASGTIKSISSLYQLLATCFIAYLCAALFTPHIFVPDISFISGNNTADIIRECSKVLPGSTAF